jgi:SpoIID/LytB domain protein
LKIKMDAATEVRVLERARSGRIKRLGIWGVRNAPATGASQPLVASVTLQGDSQIRAMLTGKMGSTTALPSSTFVALPQQNPDGTVAGWILKGAGWGHGVGMCQRGAQNHALNGWDARRILRHYYTGVEIQKMD